MAYEYRRPILNLSGTLSVPCSSTDTQISSTVLTDLPTDYSSGQYVPLLLANDTTGKVEIVWVVGHTSGTASVTVLRGRENTTPQQWAAGDVVRCAPTLRDATPIYVQNAASLPTDAHVGCRAAVVGKGLYVRTPDGWQAARRTLCIARLTTSFNYSTNVDNSQRDVFAQAGWSAYYDPDSRLYISAATGDYCYVTVPETRSYDVLYRAAWKPSANSGTIGAKVTRNGRDVNNSVASNNAEVAWTGESWVYAERLAVPLNAGDKLYWSNWADLNGQVVNQNFGIPTELVVRFADTVG